MPAARRGRRCWGLSGETPASHMAAFALEGFAPAAVQLRASCADPTLPTFEGLRAGLNHFTLREVFGNLV